MCIRDREITDRYPNVHGGPVQIGDPAAIGIKDINRPDYGDAVEIRRSKYETKLVRLSNKSFCDILQKKMLMGVLGHEE